MRSHYSGDRRALLYVDDTPDQDHWLRPLCDGLDFNGYANLPAGTFATDVPPPPGPTYAGTTSAVYVRLADGGDPNGHRVRVAARRHYFLFVGGVREVAIRGLAMRLAGDAGVYGALNGVTLAGNDIALTKGFAVGTFFCTGGNAIVGNRFHHNEYEGVHLQSDGSRVEGNLIEATIAPWAKYGAVGVNVSGGSGNTIRGNTIRGMRLSVGGTGGTGLFNEDWYNTGCRAKGGGDNRYEQNRLSANEGGGFYGAGDNLRVVNNLVHGNGRGGINLERGSPGANGGGDAGLAPSRGNAIYNNTVYNNGHAVDWGTGIATNPGVEGTQVANNIVWGNRGAIYAAGSGEHYRANLTADPAFVAPAAGDLRLQAGSPAIAAGENLYGQGVTTDIDGAGRPASGPFDAGAHGDGAAAPSTPPSATSFADVAPSDPASTAIDALVERGVIRGCDTATNRFCPADPALRAQMAAMIARAMGWDGENHGNRFTDRCDATQGCIDDDLWRNVGTLQVTPGGARL